MQFRDYAASTRGLRSAEARHGGVLRGGYTDGTSFYYCARGCWRVPLSEVVELVETKGESNDSRDLLDGGAPRCGSHGLRSQRGAGVLSAEPTQLSMNV